MQHSIKSLFAKAGLIVPLVAILFLAGCQKDGDIDSGIVPEKSQSVDDPQVKQNFVELAREIPSLAIYNKAMDKVIVIDMKENGERDFSFSSPNDGWNFSNSTGVEYVEGPQGGGILFVGPGALGSNTGGTVVAGDASLDITYTFCFSASDEGLGLDFSFTPGWDGVSSVMGIAGDFEALQNEELEDDELYDYFQGFAVYIVYDNEASGSYDILNWFEDLEDPADELEGDGFTYVIDFQNLGIYFSSDGSLNVSGGSMTFNGEYFAFTDLFEDLFNGNDPENLNLYQVEGFGTMGCN